MTSGALAATQRAGHELGELASMDPCILQVRELGLPMGEGKKQKHKATGNPPPPGMLGACSVGYSMQLARGRGGSHPPRSPAQST